MSDASKLDENPYYRWWYGIERAGVPLQAVTEYYKLYDPESVFTITFDGEEYEYPFLTRDEWQWNTDSFEFQFNEEQKRTAYELYYITSAISRMAYAADGSEVNTVEEVEEYVWNGDLYTVNTVQDKVVELINSDFYSVLSSSEPYIAEMNSFLYDSNISRATTNSEVQEIVAESTFRERDANAKTLDRIIKMSSQTELPIGGTYTVILATEDGYECLVSRRSTEVNSWPEYWTVLPAGYFAPESVEDTTVRGQFFTEYCEELFGFEEGSVTGESTRLQIVKEQLDEGRAEFAVTGIGVEGVGLSFEASGVFIIHNTDDAQEFKETIESNYEVASMEFVPLDDTEIMKDFLTPDDVTSPSAFSLVNALRYLKYTLSKEDHPESVSQLEV